MEDFYLQYYSNVMQLHIFLYHKLNDDKIMNCLWRSVT